MTDGERPEALSRPREEIEVLSIVEEIKGKVHQRYEERERELQKDLHAGRLGTEVYQKKLMEARERFALEFPKQDPLTGLPERALLYAVAWRLAQREISAGVLYFDMNNLTEFNENFDPKGGDISLIATAIVLETIARKYQTFCVRYNFGGGDDFAIIFANKVLNELVEIQHETEALLAEETALDNLVSGKVCNRSIARIQDGQEIELALSAVRVGKVGTEKPGLLEIITPITCASDAFLIKPTRDLSREDCAMMLEESFRISDRRIASIKSGRREELRGKIGSQHLIKK